ncbi:MAG: dockerin type I repeat-containing protein [Polyangiaceae bacterium]
MQTNKRSRPPRTALALLAALGALSPAAPALAQCPAPTPILPWVASDIGSLNLGSAAESSGVLQLCSANSGLGVSVDAYRIAQRALEGDFTVETEILAVDPGGAGGLIVGTVQVPGPDSPRVAVLAEPIAGDATSVRLKVSTRSSTGADAVWAQAQPVISLPVQLRIQRQSGILEVEYDHQGQTALLHTQPTAGTELSGALGGGPIQTSNDAQTPRSAWFGGPTATLPELPPAPVCSEDGVMMADGQSMAIRGYLMDHAVEVLVDGAPAPILEQTPSRIVVQPPAGASPTGRRSVKVRGNGNSGEVPGDVAFVGNPFVRGDVNQDGSVTSEDWRQICYAIHRSNPPSCMAAGDINADGLINEDDLDQLERFLVRGTDPPAGPFPAPGLVAGGHTCGLPAAPQLTGITDAAGGPVSGPLSEGDTLVIHGQGLSSAADTVLLFGDVHLDVTGDGPGNGTELHARVGKVIGTGTRCPVLMTAPLDPSKPGATRFGPAYAVNAGSPLCLDFMAGSDARAMSASFDATGTLTLDVPRSFFTPGSEFVVDAAFLAPFVDGQVAGPRTARLLFKVPTSPTGADTYDIALAQLADVLAKKLNGHNDTGCSCEVHVEASPADEKVILAPCAPPPPPPPEPLIPGLPTQIKPIQIIAGHLNLNSNFEQPTCAQQYDIWNQPRAHGWCEFEEQVTVAQGGPFAGLPDFEQMMPVRFIPGVLPEAEPYKSPADRTITQKGIMVSADMFDLQSFHDGDYNNPCGLTLRTRECGDPESDWVRPLRAGTNVIKTVWRKSGKLPLTMDETKLYSYVDPDGATQYLVGMHIAVSDGFADSNHYLRWNTFWAPAPFGDTVLKDGSPLEQSYSPYCTAGHGSDRPAELNGTLWQDWHMCNDSAPGEGACGNPWIAGECPAPPATSQSFSGCHEGPNGSMSPGGQLLQTGWIAVTRSLTAGRAEACVDYLDTHPLAFLGWQYPKDGPYPARCAH